MITENQVTVSELDEAFRAGASSAEEDARMPDYYNRAQVLAWCIGFQFQSLRLEASDA